LLQDVNINIVITFQFILYFTSVYVLKRFVPVRKKLHIVRQELAEEDAEDFKVYPIYPVKEKISMTED